jgi:hypothetical protein
MGFRGLAGQNQLIGTVDILHRFFMLVELCRVALKLVGMMAANSTEVSLPNGLLVISWRNSQNFPRIFINTLSHKAITTLPFCHFLIILGYPIPMWFWLMVFQGRF